MPDAALSVSPPRSGWQWHHVAALIGANIALALGPWSVRLSDAGPISTGFWRMILPVPLLFGLAIAGRQHVLGFAPRTYVAIAIAGLAFAADLASWHIGIGLTRMGNVTLLGNAGSFVIMLWGIVALRRLPFRGEVLSIAAVLVGSAIMLGRSLEIGASTIAGDLYCILAGLLYSIYIITLQKARATLGSWALLAWASLLGAPLLLIAGPLHGEPFWPTRWWPLFTLALGSQVIGQGLLVYALRHFSPLVIGISLLTQPVVAVVVGWFVFGETLNALDFLGMALVGAALVMARAGEKPAAG